MPHPEPNVGVLRALVTGTPDQGVEVAVVRPVHCLPAAEPIRRVRTLLRIPIGIRTRSETSTVSGPGEHSDNRISSRSTPRPMHVTEES